MNVIDSTIKVRLTEKSRIHDVDLNNVAFGKVFSDHMFDVDYRVGNWQQPEIIPYGPMAMCPSISALHYGQAIFEGMKAYKSPLGDALLFRPLDNWRRFNHSGSRLCMPEVPQELFMNGLTELVRLEKDWIPTAEKSA